MAILLGLVAAYGASVLLLWAFQERIAFPGPRAPLPDPARVLGYGERIELAMRDGTRLAGWFLPPEDGGGRRKTADRRGADLRRPAPPSAALLWFYGNGETIAAIWPVIRDFRPPDAALLMVDYPGYGASGGRTTEAGLYEAGALAYAALASRPGVDRNRIYVYGRSLGSAVATRTAADHPVAGLILESPFTNARDMATRHFRLFALFPLRLGLDNLATIRRVRGPVLIFHGTGDALVPFEMGRRVAQAAQQRGPVEFVILEGSGHNETYDAGGRAYRDKLWRFVGRAP
ncbi:MAG TPA: alpha/beta hydrolase [Gemmatimonadales bacterium]|nr:alpha/beta hydrolase [Gemmatimonadales bacterium]